MSRIYVYSIYFQLEIIHIVSIMSRLTLMVLCLETNGEESPDTTKTQAINDSWIPAAVRVKGKGHRDVNYLAFLRRKGATRGCDILYCYLDSVELMAVRVVTP